MSDLYLKFVRGEKLVKEVRYYGISEGKQDELIRKYWNKWREGKYLRVDSIWYSDGQPQELTIELLPEVQE